MNGPVLAHKCTRCIIITPRHTGLNFVQKMLKFSIVSWLDCQNIVINLSDCCWWNVIFVFLAQILEWWNYDLFYMDIEVIEKSIGSQFFSMHLQSACWVCLLFPFTHGVAITPFERGVWLPMTHKNTACFRINSCCCSFVCWTKKQG